MMYSRKEGGEKRTGVGLHLFGLYMHCKKLKSCKTHIIGRYNKERFERIKHIIS